MASIAAMLRKLVPVAAVVLGLGSALLVAACGDSNQPSLPRAEADKLLAELEAIQENFDAEECTVASLDANDLVNRVQQLPDSVDPELRRALENGSEQLALLLSDPRNCEEQTETTETAETTEETETTETTEETTETTETTEPTEPTVPTEPTTTDGSGGVGI